jgi:hypothetical protein
LLWPLSFFPLSKTQTATYPPRNAARRLKPFHYHTKARSTTNHVEEEQDEKNGDEENGKPDTRRKSIIVLMAPFIAGFVLFHSAGIRCNKIGKALVL